MPVSGGICYTGGPLGSVGDSSNLSCLSCTCAEGIQYSWFVCVSVYLICQYVCNSDFSKVAKNWQSLVSTSTTRQYVELNSLRSLNKGFIHYKFFDMICLPRTPLWHIPDFPEDKLESFRSPELIMNQYSRYSYMLTAELHSKQ